MNLLLCTALGLVTAVAQAAVTTPTPPLKGYGIVAYSSPDAATTAWMDQRFEVRLAGPKPGSTAVKWMGYQDIYGLGSIAELLEMKDWALSKRLVAEDMLLHAKADYTARIGRIFDGLDRFDAFEGRNGVLRSTDGRTFTDVSPLAYAGQVALSGETYIGYEEPYADIRFTLAMAGVEVVRSVQYWNGSAWANLVNGLQDDTASLTRSGKLSFVPPADWQPTSLNGSRRKYFVRLVVSAARVVPVSSQIRGDDWLGATPQSGRGWDASSPSIVHRGTPLAYNPTPPAGATAKFPYQARISFWSVNHFVANPADQQGLADGTWATFLADKIVKDSRSSGAGGVMCDDGERDVADDGVPATATDFADKAGTTTWAAATLAKYRNLVRLVRQQQPALLLGVNAASTALAKAGQWNIVEYHTFVWKTNDLRGITSGDDGRPTRMAYDDYLPASNPGGTLGVFLYADTEATVAAGGAAWDRGNRGPIAALSKHHIARNANTVFAYYSRGGYIYSETDEVLRVDGVVLHQAKQALPRLDQVRRWATWFPAMGVDIGVPDARGYRAGVRDLAWKRGADLGGGPDVWRRDYTNAVVLHRPAAWNTTAAQYTVTSPAIDLGGRYYPLAADGSAGAAVTSVRLRAGEGAILLKSPR
ncbi:hypothetical protein [Sphaerotilus sp.]|uniref:hypothetical protein n=1 Tax=Sphaerotilus sp. TaxID=2093942 RepID=UPI00286DE167|nr:hypothetical protein [Sphaerotilus sp.]